MAVLFGVLTLVTGPLWARRAWGTFWVWDARTTSSLVQWMVAWAYLIVRRYGGPGSEKLAAGLALFGMANVPFIYISVNYWRTIHPATSVVPTLPFTMGFPLVFCLTAFTLLFVLLLKLRVRLEEQRATLDTLYLRLDEQQP
jgi:heme exporter protein C